MPDFVLVSVEQFTWVLGKVNRQHDHSTKPSPDNVVQPIISSLVEKRFSHKLCDPIRNTTLLLYHEMTNFPESISEFCWRHFRTVMLWLLRRKFSQLVMRVHSWLLFPSFLNKFIISSGAEAEAVQQSSAGFGNLIVLSQPFLPNFLSEKIRR